ncbi:hypothetical protein Dimus_017527 [Dionaea muscipula]
MERLKTVKTEQVYREGILGEREPEHNIRVVNRAEGQPGALSRQEQEFRALTRVRFDFEEGELPVAGGGGGMMG